MVNFNEFSNQAIEITGTYNLSFKEVVEVINYQIKKPIRYTNPNPIKYFVNKLLGGYATGYILVLIVLHTLPRFQAEPVISTNIHQIIGKDPTSLKDFITREKKVILVINKYHSNLVSHYSEINIVFWYSFVINFSSM